LKSRRTAVLVGLVLAALTASCTSDPSSTSHGGQKSLPVHVRSLRLQVLPPIAQSGVAPAAADAAASVLVATAAPARRGAEIALQRRTATGWRETATSTTDAQGLARFRSPAAEGQSSEAYRVVSAADPRVHSQPGDDEWAVDFSDEFGGKALGPDWSYRQLGLLSAASGRTVSASSRDAVRVRDGVLDLQVKADPQTKGHYLNGHISTEASYSFTYGIAAARIKFQRPRGAHGSFWSQSPTVDHFPGDPARAGAEVDVAEYFGDGFPHGGLASYVYHYDKNSSNSKDGDVLPRAVRAVGSAKGFWRRYHVYSVEWSPDGYVFRIDGKRTFQTDEAVSKRSQFLVLSLLSSDWELPQLDKHLLPGTMAVDWVRVWQRKP
jgi:beta-glucanase (GH16 family)